MNKTLLLQLLLLFLPLFATAQKTGFEMGSPIIQNYTPEEYQADGQNWAALQDQNGIMYFGNNDGVLEYDGVSWNLIPTEKKSVVRSLAIDKDNRIYVGAYGEIGYLAPDTAGQLQYISLLPFLDKKYHNFPDVWQTVTANNKIYFVTQKYVFCWANQQMRVLEGQNSLHIGMAVNDQFYVRQRNVGLMKTVADSLVLVPGGEAFADEWIFVMLPFSERDGNGQQKDVILLGTQRRGLLLYDGQSVKPFLNEINDQLRKGQIYHGAKLPNGDYAFATIQDGVYVMDGAGQLRHHLNKKTGLQNNTAWFLYTDRQGGLWAGLDDGISRAEATAPLTQFTGSEGIEGAVLNIARHQGTLYAATSLGTYYLDENRGQPMAGAQFKRVEGISPQCFALLPMGQSLLAASYEGVFEIRGHRAKMVKEAYAFSLHRSQQDTNRVLVGLQKGILSLYHTDDGWRDEGYMENIEVEISKILETPDNKLWLTTRYQGALQVDLSNGFTLQPPVLQFDTLHGLPPGDKVIAFSTKKGLRFGTHHGIYEFDEKRQHFMPDTSLVRGFPAGRQQIYSVSKDEAGNIWLVTGNKSNSGLALLQGDGSYAWDERPLMRVAGANFLFAYPDPIKEGITWLGSIGRVIQYDATVSKNYSADFKTLIRQVIANGDSLIFGGDDTAQTDSPVELAYAFNTLRFVYGAPSFDDESKTRFQYLLEGYDEGWSKWSTESHKDYTKLPPGKYTFKVRSKNIYQHIGTTAVYNFEIRPPFYLRWWAFLFYGLLLTMVFWGIRQFELKKLRKKQALKLELLEYNKLKELDQMKSRFFADITHEFRTPLTVILGINEQMANSSQQWAVSSELPTVKGKLKLVKRNSENLLRLINQLLDLAKLESNTLNINYIQGDVLPYLRYISESLHSLANAQNVLLRVESDQPAIVMDYNPERLLQIVHNLLSNAVKFTPSGGRVVLRADLAGFKNLPSLNLTINDTGAGIPLKDLPYIFDRFYQANTPPSGTRRAAEAGGTGIGLALTKELVGMMGGDISVESEVGKGTTFTVNLPITNKAIFSSAVQQFGSSITLAETGQLPTVEQDRQTDELQNLLLIEDNPDVVEYLTACLQGSYALDFAYNGRSGIEKALESIPDIIISDVMMPEKDGFEVTDTLKNDERTSHIPIVLLTAKADIQSRLDGLRRGADAYLSKPFHQEELELTLANLLEMRKKMQAKFASLQLADLVPTSRDGSQRPMTEFPQPIDEVNLEDAFLKKAISHLENHLDDASYSVPQLSRAMGLSQSQLYRKIKALTDLSTVAFIRRFRLQKGKHLLETTNLTVSEIAYQVGFTTLSYFSDAFLEEFGLRPNAMRN